MIEHSNGRYSLATCDIATNIVCKMYARTYKLIALNPGVTKTIYLNNIQYRVMNTAGTKMWSWTSSCFLNHSQRRLRLIQNTFPVRWFSTFPFVQAVRWHCGRELASYAEDLGSIPGGKDLKTLKQVVTPPLPNSCVY